MRNIARTPACTGTNGSSTGKRLAKLLWTLAGALAAVLTAAWALWFGPNPVLGPEIATRDFTSRISLPAYAAALAAWGCFSKASRS